MRNIVYLAILIFIFSSSTCTNVGVNDQINFDSSLLYDMYLPHEGLPAGVPDDYGWKTKPIIGAGAKIPKGWNVITAWGTVSADESSPNPDMDFPLLRVHVKDLNLFILRNNGNWDLVQNVQTPIGNSYVEDFVDDISKKADIHKEWGGGISIQAGSGFNFHFFPVYWEEVDPNNVKAVFVICKARLIGTENYEDPTPKYLISVGADYWRSMDCDIVAANNRVVGIGRLKYITPEWKYYIMHTLSREEAELIVSPVEQ